MITTNQNQLTHLLHYFTGYERLLFLESQQDQKLPKTFTAKLGEDLIVPCKPTHPNVYVSLFQVNDDDDSEKDEFQVASIEYLKIRIQE
jgi:hypothetical protein